MRNLAVLLLFSAVAVCARENAPKIVLLWPNGAPGAVGNEDLDKPSLAYYLPDSSKAVGAGVIVCPGGGYAMLAMSYEGVEEAHWLNSLGIAAFVLKYRLGPRYHHPAELHDAQRAIRMVRSEASNLGIQPDRIGIWGFSAGGHLASTAETHFDFGDPGATDPIGRVSSRPDFAILAYPVITLKPPYAHMGSRNMLLGENPDPKLVEFLSNETQVTPLTPPTFLFSTDADTLVPAENAVFFFLALRKAHVPAEIHVFARGAHGAGMGEKDPSLAVWPNLLANWLRVRGLLPWGSGH